MSSTTQYIEVDSRYRNRNQDPLPGSFTVLSSQAGPKNQFQALDPVSDAAPNVKFVVNDFNITANLATLTPLVIVAYTAATSGANTTGDLIIASIATGLGHRESNYYTGSVLFNSTNTGRSRITSWEYDHTSGGLDFFRINIVPSYGTFAPADVLTISNASDITDPSNPSFFIPMDGFTIFDNYYDSFILWNDTLQDWRNIGSYNGTTHIAYLDVNGVPLAGWANTNVLVVRRLAPQELGTLQAGSTTTNIVLGVGAVQIDDFYIGSWLRLPAAVNVPDVIVRIVDYDGATQTATVNPALAAAPGAGRVYEILQFSYDNAVPLNYNGTLTSSQNSVCYEIQLLNLVLPNRTLRYGSRIAFYPYVYVVFQPVGGSMGASRDLIYSNNPNSRRVLFRCPVTDTTSPLVTPFITLDGAGMVQTVKFKPNQSFEFQVLLPSGDIFETVSAENFGPQEPNPVIQISAAFGFTRL